MPRMVDKYTPEEEAQLAAINSKYSERIKAAYVRLSSAIGAWAKRAEGQSLEYYQALEAAMEAASAAASRLNEAMLSETGAIQEAAEERLFQSYGGDLDAMEEMIRATTPGIVATSRAFAGEPPTEEERAEEKTRAEQARQSLEEAIKTNEALMKERPDDQQLKEDTDGLKKMLEDGSYSPKPVYDMLYSSEALKKSLLDTFSRYLDYFQEKDKARYDRVIAFFEACVAMREEYARKEEPEEKKEYRTRAKAQEAGAIADMPTALVVPTLEGYQNSMSLYQSGEAYLQPLQGVDNLNFKDGKLFFDGLHYEELEARLQNLKTKEGIVDIDLPGLRVYYSIILHEFIKSGGKRLKDIVEVSIPQLAQYRRLVSNLSKANIDQLVRDTQRYHNIVGVVINRGKGGAQERRSYYQVLNFEYYDAKHNVVAFSSPYMNYMIKTIYKASICTTKIKGEDRPQIGRNGKPVTKAAYSWLIDPSITKEKNKAAVENVVLIVTGIERAGRKQYHIAASLLIERNPQLQMRLEKDPNHRSQLLSRTFKKTWELLRTKTKLQETYPGIQLPDPNDPKNIPTVSNLESLVFEIKHNGKRTGGNQNAE